MKSFLATETRPIGELLNARGLLSEDDLKNALALQQERRDKLGRILIDLGYVAERDIVNVLSEQLKIPIYTGEYPAVPVEQSKLPYRFLRNVHVLPVHVENGILTVVMADPLDADTLSAVRQCTGHDIRVFLGAESEIASESQRLYGNEELSDGKLIEAMGEGFGADDENIEHLRDLASEVPVIRMVNLIISRAVEARASDIHVEPFEKDLRIRYRVDGVLHNIEPPLSRSLMRCGRVAHFSTVFHSDFPSTSQIWSHIFCELPAILK